MQCIITVSVAAAAAMITAITVAMIVSSPGPTTDARATSPLFPTPTASSSQDYEEGFKAISVFLYNNSTKARLGEQASVDFTADGWDVLVAKDRVGKVATSTAYYRTGTNEERAAKKLAARFGLRAEPGPTD